MLFEAGLGLLWHTMIAAWWLACGLVPKESEVVVTARTHALQDVRCFIA